MGGVSKYKIGTQDAYGIENLTWTPQVRFAGNTVRNNRARGALFSTPRRNTDYPPFHFNRDTFRLERVTNVHIEQ